MKLEFSFLYRKKYLDSHNMTQTKFARVLGLMDIVALGVSCALGSSIYILSGAIINQYSGPSVLLSFMIAGMLTYLCGLSYAELASKMPRSGSAYVYIYVAIGEYAAFIMGWDLILEYVIGVAANANTLSQYINAVSNNRIRRTLESVMPIHLIGLSSYPDFLAFALTLILTG